MLGHSSLLNQSTHNLVLCVFPFNGIISDTHHRCTNMELKANSKQLRPERGSSHTYSLHEAHCGLLAFRDTRQHFCTALGDILISKMINRKRTKCGKCGSEQPASSTLSAVGAETARPCHLAGPQQGAGIGSANSSLPCACGCDFGGYMEVLASR